MCSMSGDIRFVWQVLDMFKTSNGRHRIIRILHECEVLIEKSVPRVTVSKLIFFVGLTRILSYNIEVTIFEIG